MTKYYVVDSLGIYVRDSEVSPLDAIPPGSIEPPPATTAGTYARFVCHSWSVITEAELLNLRKKAMVPFSVTPRQIRQALTKAGYRQAVEAAIAAGSQDLKDWYEFADEFQRNHSLVQELLGALGLTEKDADDVWILAGSL